MPSTAGNNRVRRSGDTMTGSLAWVAGKGPVAPNGGWGVGMTTNNAFDIQTNNVLCLRFISTAAGNTAYVMIKTDGVFFPVQAPTASLPAFVAGGLLWDSTIKRLRQGDSVAFNPVQTCIVTVLTPSANVSVDPTLGDVFTLVPAQAEAITAASQIPGHQICLIVTTSGASSFVLTFGAGFRTTGTLTTGVTTGKMFVMHFVSDGTTYNEIARTVAM